MFICSNELKTRKATELDIECKNERLSDQSSLTLFTKKLLYYHEQNTYTFLGLPVQDKKQKRLSLTVRLAFVPSDEYMMEST